MTFCKELFKISYFSTKFRDHRHFDSGDIMVLACHVMSQGHVIKGYETLWVVAHQDELPSCQVWWR